MTYYLFCSWSSKVLGTFINHVSLFNELGTVHSIKLIIFFKNYSAFCPIIIFSQIYFLKTVPLLRYVIFGDLHIYILLVIE